MLEMLKKKLLLLKNQIVNSRNFLRVGSLIGLLLCGNLESSELSPLELNQRTSAFNIARELIISEEGFRSKVYDDATGKTIIKGSKVKGYPTIGYGHRLSKNEFKSGKFLSYGIYTADLPLDVARMQIMAEEAFLLAVSIVDFSKYNKWQGAAMISLGYNAGPGVLRYVLRGKSRKEIIRRWASIITSKGKVLRGLVNRRNKEISLFLKR